MLSNYKNVGGIQEHDNILVELNWEEMHKMLGEPGPVQEPVTQPTVDHSLPGSSNENTSARRLQLRFSTTISSPVSTGKKIKGEGSETIKVVLFDSQTGKQVYSGREAYSEVEIVVLRETFDSVRSDDWTIEEFDNNIVKVGKCKKSLLTETKKLKPKLKLQEGFVILEDISFRSSSGWQGKTKFRLGVRIVDDLDWERVREAKTEPFELKDCRIERYSNHSIPSLCDDVWRLEKIGRKGKRHQRLREANIKSVKDFLILRFLNPQKLCEIYGGEGKNWDDTVRHALTCPDKMVCYPSSSREQTCVVINASIEVLGLLYEGKIIHIDDLSDSDKANARRLVISAFECPENVVYFEFPSGHDLGTKKIYDHLYVQTEPSTSTHDTFPSYNIDYYTPRSSNADYYSPRSSNAVEVVSNTLMDDEALFDLCSSYDYSIFHESCGSESRNANQLDYTNESILVRAQSGPFVRAQKRWKIFSKVWSGTWYFIKMAARRFHAKKKLRLC